MTFSNQLGAGFTVRIMDRYGEESTASTPVQGWVVVSARRGARGSGLVDDQPITPGVNPSSMPCEGP